MYKRRVTSRTHIHVRVTHTHSISEHLLFDIIHVSVDFLSFCIIYVTTFNRFTINIHICLPIIGRHMSCRYCCQAAVSIGRINKFLKSEELDEDSVSHDQRASECWSSTRAEHVAQQAYYSRHNKAKTIILHSNTHCV